LAGQKVEHLQGKKGKGEKSPRGPVLSTLQKQENAANVHLKNETGKGERGSARGPYILRDHRGEKTVSNPWKKLSASL